MMVLLNNFWLEIFGIVNSFLLQNIKHIDELHVIIEEVNLPANVTTTDHKLGIYIMGGSREGVAAV